MPTRDPQRQADDRENDAARRYQDQQLLAAMVAEAVRRADAMSRLDASLQLLHRHPAA